MIPILRIFYWLLMSVALRKALDVRKKPQSSLFQSLLPYKIMMLGIKAISCPHVDFNYQSVCSHPCAFIINFAPQKKIYIFSNHYYLLPVQCSCQLYTKRVWYDIKIFLFHSMNYSDCSLVITRTLGINRMNLLEI